MKMEIEQKIIDENDVLKEILSDIKEAVNNKNTKEIDNYIKQIAMNAKKLMSGANHDKITYMIIKLLNKIITIDPRIRVDSCQKLNEALEKGINDINFEKQTLLEIKTYLKRCKKNKDYSNLTLSFYILVLIVTMQNIRGEEMSINGDIWQNGINGISYIPVEQTNNKSETLREIVEMGVQKLKK